ncbi:MAG: hypothetical protein ACD_38C00185G0001 [uncultured bacterium]|uniref:Uncharacterized protein n=1 Tax=Candidatus Daviesbacteria bacterium GW2011_GWC2_40_12 TaxID=1618431 RepID=A0A0G0QQN4_9BACT|nr:MAG: hypothetical protein ACD_38C00185G0001 [uncultured bacterium]KKQ81200.1 MAG: hypothetical protein UT04_C0079G0006 [Candidatus Daviesbacteria bacterium GW2011_GWF2_38_7]KKR16760.1 MAG: hypothetical protein UT45_C0004G0091 [Candidatus Daviesbacteria bacterium GW2011_GWA2_39_33]KKR42458.1 MAG: hypothetical protein UT77_C0002G0111 [Candidatus Daviesbacteria bacterium GW2011_GWC2_40_12]OGE22372.1 MAG: hypothetical protein A2778_00825 [Candidatus Daviesbacteria bacterium RIFCSPHIGHO2_01_FULL_
MAVKPEFFDLNGLVQERGKPPLVPVVAAQVAPQTDKPVFEIATRDNAGRKYPLDIFAKHGICIEPAPPGTSYHNITSLPDGWTIQSMEGSSWTVVYDNEGGVFGSQVRTVSPYGVRSHFGFSKEYDPEKPESL